MKRILCFMVTFVLLISCSNSKSPDFKEEEVFDLNSPDIKQIESKFEKLSEFVYDKDNDAKLQVLIQLTENSKIVPIPDGYDIPDSAYATFSIYRNDYGQIQFISKWISSITGDWAVSYQHFFDENGNLYAFVRYSFFYNSECADVVIEESVSFYDSKRKAIKKTYKITDKSGNQIVDKSKCNFYCRYPYEIFKTLNDLIKSNPFDFENKELFSGSSNESDSIKYFSIQFLHIGWQPSAGHSGTLEITNISKMRFKNYEVSGTLFTKNSYDNDYCSSTAQIFNLPSSGENNDWEPGTKKEIEFEIPNRCLMANMHSNPDEVILVIKIDANSNNKTYSDLFKFNMFDSFKEEKAKLGYK